MDEKIDKLLRSKYTSLFCALLNMFFAIQLAMSGNFFFFVFVGLLSAYCFRNYLRAA